MGRGHGIKKPRALALLLLALAGLSASALARPENMIRISNPDNPKPYFDEIVIRFIDLPLDQALETIYAKLNTEFGVRVVGNADEVTLSIEHVGPPSALVQTLEGRLEQLGWEIVVHHHTDDIVRRKQSGRLFPSSVTEALSR